MFACLHVSTHAQQSAHRSHFSSLVSIEYSLQYINNKRSQLLNFSSLRATFSLFPNSTPKTSRPSTLWRRSSPPPVPKRPSPSLLASSISSPSLAASLVASPRHSVLLLVQLRSPMTKRTERNRDILLEGFTSVWDSSFRNRQIVAVPIPLEVHYVLFPYFQVASEFISFSLGSMSTCDISKPRLILMGSVW